VGLAWPSICGSGYQREVKTNGIGAEHNRYDSLKSTPRDEGSDSGTSTSRRRIRPLTLKNLTRRSPPATAMTPTFGFGCHVKSTTPPPAPSASFFPVVGFAWLAFRMRRSMIVPCGNGERFAPILREGSMKDLVLAKRRWRGCIPGRERLEAHSGRGWRRSNLDGTASASSRKSTHFRWEV
jgi:hypothetical protein